MKLRPYQQECVDIIDSMEKGSYLIVMSTGLGKTVIFSHIKRKGKILILSHREELVHQPEKYYDCSFGVERAGEHSNGEDVVSASVQTLVRRLDKFPPDYFDTIITDEAHHAVAPTYRKIYEHFKPRLHLGFTATPNRADNTGLKAIYQKIIYEKNIKWAINHQFLCGIECLKVNLDVDLSSVKTVMKDFAVNELGEAMNVANCNEAIREVYRKYARGQTLIFVSTVAHCYELLKYIPEAEVITGNTKDRPNIIERFKKKETRCIINCMILTEGTDLPMVETIIMCRPTANTGLYTQIVGRGLRTYEGKEKLLLIDCVGISTKLKLCTAPVLFGIDPDEAEEAGCENGNLEEMEEKINVYKTNLLYSDKRFWKINASLVDVFEDEGKYDLHNVNYTMCANKDMLCSIGNGYTIKLTAEDLVGNATASLLQYGKIKESYGEMKVQDALDKIYTILKNDYPDMERLWNKTLVMKWGNFPASAEQIKYIKKLYTNRELSEMEIGNSELSNMNKYQASCLINRGIEKGKLKSIKEKSASDKQIKYICHLYNPDEIKEILVKYNKTDIKDLTGKEASETILKKTAQANQPNG